MQAQIALYKKKDEVLLVETLLVEKKVAAVSRLLQGIAPSHDELREMVRVPEVQTALSLQKRGEHKKAAALLSQCKRDLEQQHAALKARGGQGKGGKARGDKDGAEAQPVKERRKAREETAAGPQTKR